MGAFCSKIETRSPSRDSKKVWQQSNKEAEPKSLDNEFQDGAKGDGPLRQGLRKEPVSTEHDTTALPLQGLRSKASLSESVPQSVAAPTVFEDKEVSEDITELGSVPWQRGEQVGPEAFGLRNTASLQEPVPQSVAAPTEEKEEQEDVEGPELEGPVQWKRGDQIGKGAFGTVYLAFDTTTGQLMAVKQVPINSDMATSRKLTEQIVSIEQELRVLRTLKHRNIVRYLGTERAEQSLNIFLEFVSGGSITFLIERFGPLSEDVVRVYTNQILQGLVYLHNQNVVHRDIKGANILVNDHGIVKLADFGASKKIETLYSMGSGLKSLRGTPFFMAPEVIKQAGHGREADIWSLGCTVIEMVTGKPPWSDQMKGNPVSVIFQIAQSNDIPTLPENSSPEIKDFVAQCLQRDKTSRPTAEQLLKHAFITCKPLATLASKSVASPLTSQVPPKLPMGMMQQYVVPSPIQEEPDGLQMTPTPTATRMSQQMAHDSPDSDDVVIQSPSPAGEADGVHSFASSAACNPLADDSWVGGPYSAGLAYGDGDDDMVLQDSPRQSFTLPAHRMRGDSATSQTGPQLSQPSASEGMIRDFLQSRGQEEFLRASLPLRSSITDLSGPRLSSQLSALFTPSNGPASHAANGRHMSKEEEWHAELMEELDAARQALKKENEEAL